MPGRVCVLFLVLTNKSVHLPNRVTIHYIKFDRGFHSPTISSSIHQKRACPLTPHSSLSLNTWPPSYISNAPGWDWDGLYVQEIGSRFRQFHRRSADEGRGTREESSEDCRSSSSINLYVHTFSPDLRAQQAKFNIFNFAEEPCIK